MPEVFSYMLSTVVTVYPEAIASEDSKEARISASSVITLDKSNIETVLGSSSAADYIGLVWSRLTTAGIAAAGISGSAVITGVNE
eukprot:scaffold420705_cov40-Prasinocladus_malaysianus.AAC.1